MPSFAQYFDHTLLKPDATQAQIETLSLEAAEHGFAAVCVNACWLSLVARLLKNTSVLPITVVGFPLGASTSRSKAFETEDALKWGAREIDMVLNVGFVKSNLLKEAEDDIRSVVRAASTAPVKVILETSLLNADEIRVSSKMCENAGAAFVKTSTGFGARGASVEDIRLIKESVSSNMRIKASGGLRTLQAIEAMIDAGAHRVGSSSSVQILKEKLHGSL
jgi:deoxyribose-phosphate aldolase